MIKKNLLKKTVAIMITALVLTGCSAGDLTNTQTSSAQTETVQEGQDSTVPEAGQGQGSEARAEQTVTKTSTGNGEATVLLDTSEMFSDRDLEQEADLTEAREISLKSGEDVTITEEGVYVISGTATDSTIIVEAEDTAKVQLVLDGVSITNTDAPAIYVKSADKVFVTTTNSENTLKVTGTFTADGDTNTDAVIYSKDDITLNGKGTLTIESTDNGISCKDDLKITGGTYNITCEADAIEANDSIRVYDGAFTLRPGKDALHAENEDDDSKGFIYIAGGSFDIDSDSDGIQATSVLMIDGGILDIDAQEGLEGTFVQINGGTIKIAASDDGINASSKSSAYDVAIEINGGDLTIDMASGDTDALDANGYLYINGGTVTINAQFAFDFDKEAQLNGGTVIVNGEEVTEITNSMNFGGGGMGGGFGGGMGGGRQGGFSGQKGDFSGEGFTGELPEGFDGQNSPEGFDGQTPPELPDGAQMQGDGQNANGNQKQGGKSGKQH